MTSLSKIGVTHRTSSRERQTSYKLLLRMFFPKLPQPIWTNTFFLYLFDIMYWIYLLYNFMTFSFNKIRCLNTPVWKGGGWSLTLVGLICQNYVKGGGRSALPIKNFKIRWKTIFFKVCHCLHYIKIIIVKVGLAKGKFLNKKLRRKNLRGGADLPPPGHLGLINRIFLRPFLNTYINT